MRITKALIHRAELHIEEHPEASLVDMFIAGCEYMDGVQRKNLQEERKKQTELLKLNCDPSAPTFEEFWKAYKHPMDRPKCEDKWYRLTTAQKVAIMQHVPRYVESTPDKKYRKHPLTYLNNESWNNPIIDNGNNNQQERDFFNDQAELFRQLNANRQSDT